MKTAFAYWDNRIAPVFDTARRIRVVERDERRIIDETEEELEDGSPVRKVINLSQLNVTTLVCGAISRQLHEMVLSSGIQVIPFVAGELGEITRAWLDGTLEDERFVMPGCCRGGRAYQRGSWCGMGEDALYGGRSGRQEAGRGQGRRGGPRAGGAVGSCVCTVCGYREPHDRGVPCTRKRCPACGAALTRE